MVYARTTKVNIDKTRYEIERTLNRYGASMFSYGTDEDKGIAAIMFRAHDRHIRFVLLLPNANDKAYRNRRTRKPITELIEQESRSRWRALLLCVKAKLEAVESKIETFEEAFLAHVVLPDGKTAAEWLMPQIAQAYSTGLMPKQLLALPAPSQTVED